jgi:diguanylate cyclase
MDDDSQSLNYDYAKKVADHANRLMAAHRVPHSPANYTIWFAYVLGVPLPLREKIDGLISDGRTFDKELNRDLHAEFATRTKVVDDIPQRLSGIMKRAQCILKSAMLDSDEQRTALTEFSRAAMTPAADPEPLFAQLIEELAKAQTRAADLEAGFAGASRQLDELTASLKEAEEKSNTDPLTGLANRRSMEIFLRSSQERSVATGEPLSIFMVDIDRFKAFNDRLGHPAGDQVLRLVSKLLKESLREGDLACRYGGEEFLTILPGADLQTASHIAERVRTRIAEAKLKRRSSGEELGGITVSIGAAESGREESYEALIERSDLALYTAKREGRNRTVLNTGTCDNESRSHLIHRFDR